MLRIAHRVNTAAELARVPPDEGVEVDLRDSGRRLILHHDPHRDGENFEDFLKRYRHRFIVLNVKSEGIELAVHKLVARRGIKDFFFLDVSFPALVKLVKNGVPQVAVRFSEHEPAEACLALAGKVEWVWVDCFTKLPLTPKIHAALRRRFRLCLVSPELQGHGAEKIAEYRRALAKMPVDAVCTDRTDLWK